MALNQKKKKNGKTWGQSRVRVPLFAPIGALPS